MTGASGAVQPRSICLLRRLDGSDFLVSLVARCLDRLRHVLLHQTVHDVAANLVLHLDELAARRALVERGQIVDFLRALVNGPLTHQELEAVLDKRAAQSHEKLDWRNSIVDLMKLTNQDSSLAAREQMAKEFGYSGPYDGSENMNIWLHQKVMEELSRTLPR